MEEQIQTYDIQAYLVEYREIGNLTWNDFGSFTSPGQFWFSPTKDATFESGHELLIMLAILRLKIIVM